MDQGVCRICGATVATWELLDAQRGGGCIRCDGSPLCSKCGHPRKTHFGVLSATAQKGCKVKIQVADSLATGRCGCIGYTTMAGPVAQAAFVEHEAPLVETAIPTLRIAPPLEGR